MKKVALLLYLLFSLLCEAQTFKSVNYGIRQGLISESCFTVFQDSRGFIWVGTNAGASRFNGTEFENFEWNDGLLAYSVYQIHEDSKGRIWFLTDTGKPCYYFEGKFYNEENTPFLKQMASHSYLYGFFEDHLNQIWIGSFTDGYKVLKPDNTVLSFNTNEEGNRCLFFTSSPSGEVLYVDSYSIHAVDATNFQRNWSIKVFDNPVSSLRAARLSDRYLLLQSQEDQKMVDIALRKANRTTETNNNYFNQIFISNPIDGRTFLGSRNGLTELKNGDVVPTEFESFTKGKAITGFIKDVHQNWWASTLKNGLVKIVTYPFSYNPNEKGMYLRRVFDYGREIRLYADGSMKIIKQGKESLIKYGSALSNPVEVLDIGSDRLLIFNENYVTLFIGDRRIQRTMAPKAVLLNDENSELLLGFNTGLVKIPLEEFVNELLSSDIHRFAKIMDPNMGINTLTNAIMQYKEGYLIGTREGLFYLKNNKLEDKYDFQGLHNAYIMSLKKFGKNGFLAGTYGKGIYRFDEKKNDLLVINTGQGLQNNFVYKMIKDRDDAFWALTRTGVSRLSFKDDKENLPQILNFGSNEGIQEYGLVNVYDHNGEICVNTLNGEYCSNSFQINKYHQYRPQLFLSKINGKKSTQSASFEVATKLNLEIETLSLEFGEGLQTFYSFGDDSTVWYPFKNNIILSSSHSGTHLLRVKGITKENISSSVLNIHLKFFYPWYKSWWFYAAVLLSLASLIYWLFKNGTLQWDHSAIRETIDKLRRLNELQLQLTEHIIKVTDGSFIKIQESEIYYVSAAGNYAEFHTSQGTFLSRVTMKEIEDSLDSKSNLKRIHRSFIANFKWIEKTYQSKVMINGKELPVGVNHQELIDKLKKGK